MLEMDLISYLVFFALAFIFSLLTFAWREDNYSPVYSVLAFFCWMVEGIMHSAMASDTSYFSLAFVYYGFGMIFIALTFALALEVIRKSTERKKWTV